MAPGRGPGNHGSTATQVLSGLIASPVHVGGVHLGQRLGPQVQGQGDPLQGGDGVHPPQGEGAALGVGCRKEELWLLP